MKMLKDGRFLSLVSILLVIGSTECQPWLRPRHPLCVSQFALANRACAHLPIYTVPPPSPSTPPPTPSGPPPAPQPPGVPIPPPTPLLPPVPLPPDPLPPGPPLDHPRHHDHHHNDDQHHHRGGHHHRRPNLHSHHHNGTHHHHHHNHDQENDHYRHHGHHHEHDRRKIQEDQTAEGTPVEQECCHWLEQVDTDCVCDILVNFPPFLSKPLHEYTVIVSHICNVTYACPSRIRL